MRGAAFVSLMAVLVSGCASGSSDGASRSGSDRASSAALPPEVQDACGQPGTQVRVQQRELLVRHVDCDLTGVILQTKDGGFGLTVPSRAEWGTGVGGSSGGASLSTAEATGDVTFTQDLVAGGNA